MKTTFQILGWQKDRYRGGLEWNAAFTWMLYMCPDGKSARDPPRWFYNVYFGWWLAVLIRQALERKKEGKNAIMT